MKKTLTFFSAWVAAIGLFFTQISAVYAQASNSNFIAPFQNNQSMSGGGLWTFTSLLAIFVTIVQWVYTIFFIVAVLFFLLAAYNFILGGTNEDRIKTAKNQLRWGVVAIVVALLSMGVTYAVATFLQTGA
jgi:multisubunit Na+/H+ antiporter MnhF subunit